MDKVGIGIIGCGNISEAYFKLIPLYRNLKVVACAGINMASAKARAEQFGVVAQEVDALLEGPEQRLVELVLHVHRVTERRAVHQRLGGDRRSQHPPNSRPQVLQHDGVALLSEVEVWSNPFVILRFAQDDERRGSG